MAASPKFMKNDQPNLPVHDELPTRPRGIPLWLLVFGMLLLAGVGIAALATTFIKGKGETEKASVSPVMKPAARGFFDSAPVPVDPVFAARQSEMFGLVVREGR
jgi:hypothetical protein